MSKLGIYYLEKGAIQTLLDVIGTLEKEALLTLLGVIVHIIFGNRVSLVTIIWEWGHG